MRKFIVIIAYLILAWVLYFCTQIDHAVTFSRDILNKTDAGITAIGDMDGDGHNDVVLLSSGSGGGTLPDGQLVVYLYPGWDKWVIDDSFHFRGDAIELADMNADGALDVITCQGNPEASRLIVYTHPGSLDGTWSVEVIKQTVGGLRFSNLGVADMDGDGRMDIVSRTQKNTQVYYATDSLAWVEVQMETDHQTGMALGDVDMDGDQDIVLNGYWLDNPGREKAGEWYRFTIDSQWFSDSISRGKSLITFVQVADINNDRQNDVVFSREGGSGYSITWYRPVDVRGGPAHWEPHLVGQVDYCHTLLTGDLDLDGDTDIVAGTNSLSDAPVFLLFTNLTESGIAWGESVIDSLPVFNASLGDLEGDNDLDLVSSYNWNTGPLHVWYNQKPQPGR